MASNRRSRLITQGVARSVAAFVNHVCAAFGATVR